MSAVVATVCLSCGPAQADFAETLKHAFRDAGLTVEVRGTECMSGCARAPTIAFRAEGKTAYLFGDIGQADLGDLTTFARMYAASTDGNFADARPLGGLRLKALARIPG